MSEKTKSESTKVVKGGFYQKLKSEKEIVESQLVFSLYANTNYYFDYELQLEEFDSSMWRFYYHMLKEMVEDRKLRKMDIVSVSAYVSTKNNKFRSLYEELGGYETIKKGMVIVESDNVESYYSELQRYKTLLRLIKMGFPIERNWKAYSKMDLETLNEVLEGLVSEAFVDTQIGNDRVENMFDDINNMLQKADEGEAKGLPIGSQLMDTIQNGLALGNITMMAANSGVGKTFLTTMLHILSSIHNEEPVLIIANEEERSRYMQGLLTAYINRKHRGFDFNKNRFLQGGFTDDEWEMLNEAKQWYLSKVDDGLIRFVNMNEFSMAKTIRLIKKYARLYDVRYFVLDTLKLDNDTYSRVNDNSWLQLQQNMVKLYNVIKPSNLNVHIWVTAQMTKTNRRSRYLDQSMIGMAKNVTDVVSSLMLVRMATQSEKVGDKALRVIDEQHHQKLLDEDKDYMIVFWDKNRQGRTNRQVVLEVDRGLNTVRDIGVTQIDNDLE